MWGGRLAFDKDKYLFVTLGDRPAVPDLTRHPAQDPLTHNGKTVRLYDDGRVPKDNPFVGTPHALPEIWSRGHRNAHRRPLAERARPAGRRRAEPDPPRRQLRVARDRLRRELHDRPRHSRGHAERGHHVLALVEN
jgi:hypothetical protein